jgi:hypothetical protein
LGKRDAAFPERDPGQVTLMAMWFVVDARQAGMASACIAVDPERQAFGLGSYEGHPAGDEGGSGSLLDLVARLVGATEGVTGGETGGETG